MNRCILCRAELPASSRYKNGKWPLRCEGCRTTTGQAVTFDQPTTLYRLFSAGGALLYVGVAGNPGRRFEQHHRDKPWWSEVATITLEHHASRLSALRAEAMAVAAECPLYNVALQGDVG